MADIGLTGTIPTSLGQLSSLATMYASLLSWTALQNIFLLFTPLIAYIPFGEGQTPRSNSISPIIGLSLPRLFQLLGTEFHYLLNSHFLYLELI